MSTLTANPNQTSDLFPAGEHHGVCSILLDMGHEEFKKYNTWNPKFIIGFSFPDIIAEYEEDGDVIRRPRTLTRRFKKQLLTRKGEKTPLYKFLEKWKGSELSKDENGHQFVQLDKLLGVNARIEVEHVKKPNGNIYADIEFARPLAKGTEKKSAGIDPAVFFLEKINPDINPLDQFPKNVAPFITKAFSECREVMTFKPPAGAEALSQEAVNQPADDEDDFPF